MVVARLTEVFHHSGYIALVGIIPNCPIKRSSAFLVPLELFRRARRFPVLQVCTGTARGVVVFPLLGNGRSEGLSQARLEEPGGGGVVYTNACNLLECVCSAAVGAFIFAVV